MTTPTLTAPTAQTTTKQPWLTWHGVKTVAKLELTQRLRSSRWKTVLIVWFIGVGAICLLIAAALTSTWGFYDSTVGPMIFGLTVFFILFMGLLITPSLSSTAINGDRNAGTLAILQASLLTPMEITLGKLVAGWLSSLAFIVVSIPFIIWSLAAGGVSILAVIVVLVTMAVLLGVICAISLYMSARMVKTATSTVMSYLVVATVSFITLMLFGLSTVVFGFGAQSQSLQPSKWDPETGNPTECTVQEYYSTNPRTDLTWWLLAVNPYVIISDVHVPSVSTKGDISSDDPLAAISTGVRQLRANSDWDQNWESMWCNPDGSVVSAAEYDRLQSLPPKTAGPVWPIGLGVYLLVGALAINRTARRLRIPYDTLAKGVRIA